jgi:nitrogen regulatory protein PII
MYMVMFVLDDPNSLDKILDTWHEIGIGGTTIFDTTGFFRQRSKRLNIPMRYNLPRVTTSVENHFTLMAIVPSEEIVNRCLVETEKIVGDLDQPNTGVFSAWPLSLSKGVPMEKSGG